ncbi:hypothetical protein K402DRAFT_404860 [Aulographum hederae CBS 113979]|uniref:Uncharacterized protein n=1 Tax=Aulographum hederae CBS 113979 TaxID=1176131 RepID=A0A6G1GXN7_9PEZI|nr:hypothetical protein K402DRAFT_404860 [Aulographum hederae CBS 113979]
MLSQAFKASFVSLSSSSSSASAPKASKLRTAIYNKLDSLSRPRRMLMTHAQIAAEEMRAEAARHGYHGKKWRAPSPFPRRWRLSDEETDEMARLEHPGRRWRAFSPYPRDRPAADEKKGEPKAPKKNRNQGWPSWEEMKKDFGYDSDEEYEVDEEEEAEAYRVLAKEVHNGKFLSLVLRGFTMKQLMQVDAGLKLQKILIDQYGYPQWD